MPEDPLILPRYVREVAPIRYEPCAETVPFRVDDFLPNVAAKLCTFFLPELVAA